MYVCMYVCVYIYIYIYIHIYIYIYTEGALRGGEPAMSGSAGGHGFGFAGLVHPRRVHPRVGRMLAGGDQ